jgi:hypothetical protein
MKKIIAATFAVALSFAVRAEDNPLQFDRNVCSLDAGGVLTLQTLPTPKGWFTSKGDFDRRKTDLRTTYTLSTSTCDLGAGAATLSSTALGTFVQTPVLNPNAKDTGYVWNMVGDLSANQNHWWYFVGCDGVPVKVGCDQSRDATFTTTAYGNDGQCRTYVNASGVTTCATDTIAFQLASIQDPDQVIDPALCQPVEPACGIGPCVSARVQAGGTCDTDFPVNLVLDLKSSNPKNPKYYDANEKARSDCKTGASCFCKALLPAECQNGGNDCQ